MSALLSAPAPSGRSPLLSLSPELRNKIYEYFSPVEGGYVYNPLSGKLRCANGDPINLSLMFCCKQTAYEMDGLLLSANTITFRTVDDSAFRVRAARFDFLNDLLYREQLRLVKNLRHCLDSEAVQKIVTRYPNLTGLALPEDLRKEYFQGQGETSGWSEDVSCEHDYMRDGWKALRGHVPSITRQALTFILELAAKNESFAENVDRMFQSPASGPYDWWTPRGDWEGSERISDPWKVIELSHRFPPWSIPTDLELDEIASVIGNNPQEQVSGKPWADHWKCSKGKFRFSATAAAISFLSRHDKSIIQIRQICVDESCIAVAYPESHALGLVSLCNENPLLRVERRVNVWRCLLPSGGEPSSTLRSDPNHMINDFGGGYAYRGLERDDAVQGAIRWLVEADGLAPAGMPNDCFKFILDGTPASERCSEIFHDVVLSAATWHQTWIDRYADDASLFDAYRESELAPSYTPSFPRVVWNFIRGDSFISANFDLGNEPLWNLAKLRADHHMEEDDVGAWAGEGLPTHLKWDWKHRYPIIDAYRASEVYYIDTVTPLPTWEDLLDDLHGTPLPLW